MSEFLKLVMTSLQEVIDEEVLYPHWGGCRPADSPTGHVRMGGRVPKSEFWQPAEPPADAQRLHVPARGRASVPVRAAEAGAQLEWWWRCEGGDLDFWVEAAEEEGAAEPGPLAWPRFRVLTQFVPESRRVSADLGQLTQGFRFRSRAPAPSACTSTTATANSSPNRSSTASRCGPEPPTHLYSRWIKRIRLGV